MLLSALLLAALAAPAAAGTYTFTWLGDSPAPGRGGPIGVEARFGTGMYNYTTLPAGTTIRPGFEAPKFFYKAEAASRSHGAITVRDLSAAKRVHCVDAGPYPHNGAILTLQPCDGSRGQRWVVNVPEMTGDEPTGRQGTVQLSNSNLCWDMTDGDDIKPLQVWRCVPGNSNQDFRVLYRAT
ncbi:hypothetical protein Q8F55_004903 [Vanrija albida]|uniref:Ricin B lectin domain-containing protein n=1 Tax=Vanrija albida TaxID=181172 RepID=A0ABR3Q059_9TREE